MKALNITLNLLMLIVVGILIWAIWPWLLKFLLMAQQLHNLGL